MITSHSFTIVDYVLFISTLVISLSIGLISAFRKRNENTTGEYLMGGRKLKLIPVTLSILVTYVSAIGILGTPAEIYGYGTQFSLQILAMMVGNTVGAYLFVPVYYPLRLTSCFEVISCSFCINKQNQFFSFVSVVLHIKIQ